MRKILLVAMCCAIGTSSASTILAQDDNIGVDMKAMNKSVRAQDDLFEYVNGTWLSNTDIPADKSNFGSFIILADKSQERVREIIETAAKEQHQSGSNEQKVADFYRSFMNVKRIEELGITPIQEHIDKVRQIKSKKELLDYWAALQKMGIGSPIGFFVTQDGKDATRYAAHLIQSGTTLPDKDYYLKDDDKSAEARKALEHYMARLFVYADLKNPYSSAAKVAGIEKELARYQWPRTKLRNPKARYNKFSVADWQAKVPQIDWASYFKNSGVSIDEIIVMTPSFFEYFGEVFDKVSLEDWKIYTEFNLLDGAAPYLSSKFADAHFDLQSRQLAGIKQQKDRWKRAVEATAGAGAGSFGVLGEVVGEMYVDKYFKADSKAAMEKLVDNLLKAFDQSIDELTWMTDETKKRAKEKLAKITPKIGYPNKWRDYSKLEIKPDDLVGNMMRSAAVEHDRMISKLGKPIDREEWGMTPQTVNAYYNPGKNEIVFPAAILQPPFFSINADAAINYGGIGAVIGHEISHAFDDSGSQYDGDGNLKNWWTDNDRAAFSGLTKRLIEQYADYEPLPEKKVNGQLTLGENIADLSGLAIAFKAYKLSLNGQPSKMIAGWTGEQRFFVGWSQVWRRKYREAEMVRRLLTDPHSPSRYRANGPVMNIDAFYEAFDVKKGDKLYKPVDERIRIW
jgi:endothelin-converting enzyme